MGILNMRPDFDKQTIDRCKKLLAMAYQLEEEQIDPEAIMRMAIFISVVFAHNAGLDPNDYVDIIKDTWARMYIAVEEESTEDMEDIQTWVSDKPITDEDQ
tara:strand:+ start:410 stop:712 length:303 start_codon:yes stop_codon:yes gene_type:complete